MTLPFSTFFLHQKCSWWGMSSIRKDVWNVCPHIYSATLRCIIWYLTIEEQGMYPVRFPDPLVRKWVGKPDYDLLTGVITTHTQVTWLKGEECFWITLNQRTCPTTNILVCVGLTPRWRRSTYSWQPQRGVAWLKAWRRVLGACPLYSGVSTQLQCCGVTTLWCTLVVYSVHLGGAECRPQSGRSGRRGRSSLYLLLLFKSWQLCDRRQVFAYFVLFWGDFPTVVFPEELVLLFFQIFLHGSLDQHQDAGNGWWFWKYFYELKSLLPFHI